MKLKNLFLTTCALLLFISVKAQQPVKSADIII